MPQTIEQIYSETIKPLSGGERLRLAKLILNDIPSEAVTDWDDDWSEEDLRDATRYALHRAEGFHEEQPTNIEAR